VAKLILMRMCKFQVGRKGNSFGMQAMYSPGGPGSSNSNRSHRTGLQLLKGRVEVGGGGGDMGGIRYEGRVADQRI
jgi:hypothetical protein